MCPDSREGELSPGLQKYRCRQLVKRGESSAGLDVGVASPGVWCAGVGLATVDGVKELARASRGASKVRKWL